MITIIVCLIIASVLWAASVSRGNWLALLGSAIVLGAWVIAATVGVWLIAPVEMSSDDKWWIAVGVAALPFAYYLFGEIYSRWPTKNAPPKAVRSKEQK